MMQLPIALLMAQKMQEQQAMPMAGAMLQQGGMPGQQAGAGGLAARLGMPDKGTVFSQPGGLTGLLENPLFNVGMGLLNSRATGSSPYQEVLGGLSTARQNRTAAEDRRAREETIKALQELFKRRNPLQSR